MEFEMDLTQEGVNSAQERAVGEVLDVSRAKVAIQLYQSGIAELRQEVKALVVKDEPSDKVAADIGLRAKKMAKEVEKQWDAVIERPKSFIADVRKVAKPMVEAAESIIVEVETKRRSFKSLVEQKRREEEKALRDEQDRLQAQLKAEAAEKGIEAVEIPTLHIPEVKQVTRTDSGSVSSRKKWVISVLEPFEENIKKVPANLLMLDESKVRSQIKLGVTQIDGLDIHEEEISVYRT